MVSINPDVWFLLKVENVDMIVKAKMKECKLAFNFKIQQFLTFYPYFTIICKLDSNKQCFV